MFLRAAENGAALSNIEITDANIAAFKPCAKKCGVDFTLRKDKTTQPPHYIVIFKSRDADNLEQAGESNSIQNQKKYLEEYARQHGLRNIRHFYGDGYSGTNFNRPGFAALLEEVEAGR